jgi:CubicO group peptidase (beta-lactamase class C family)
MKTMVFSVLFFLFLPLGLGAQAARALEPGRTYSDALAAGERHEYELALAADWFISGRVDQDGLDVEVLILGPDGERAGRFAAIGRGGPESFRLTTQEPGRYVIAVAPAAEDGAGEYRIRLERSEPVATSPEGKIDQVMSMFGDDTPGAIVAVIRGGRLDFVRSYGLANLSYMVPFTENTVTNIGSTSKQFTGFAVALLQARGRLSLDDDVRDYIPELPDFGETVTLRHLASHTGGYREFVNTLLLAGRQVLESDYIGPDEVIQVVQNQPRLQNSPGAEFNYNNTAFGLLTIVVERVTGLPFEEWMAQEVFGPLGMTHTVVRAHTGQVIAGRAAGYAPSEAGFREVRDLAASIGAGGIYTTVGDLARWMGNFRTAQLGGPEVIRELTTPNVLTSGDTTNYGLGLFIDSDRGLVRWQHGGSDVAHRSTFVYYPDLDAGYVVLSNYAAAPGAAGRTVAETFFGEHMESPTEGRAAGQTPDPAVAIVPAATLDLYAARYELTTMPGMVITISNEGGTLHLHVAGQSMPLTPTSDSTFALQAVDAQVTFHREGEGELPSLTFHQDGDHPGRRLPDVVEAVDLTEYEGRYFSAELETFYVLEADEEHLLIRQRRFGTARLEHSEGDTFTGSLPVSLMVFERDSSGRVTGFHAGNGRARDIWFQRQER